MSSTEQAPEPTMDEILASIRKIISDDEPDQNAQAETGADDSSAADDYTASMADTPAMAEAPAQAGEQDDILDLTQVVQSPVEPTAQQPEAGQSAPPANAPQEDALQAAMAQVPTDPVADTPAAATDAGGADIASLLAEAGVEDTVSETTAASEPSAEEASITAALNSIGVEPDAPAASDAPAGGQPFPEAAAPATSPEASLEADPVPGDEARDALDDLVASLETEVNTGLEDAPMDQTDPAAVAEAAGEPAMEMPAPAIEEPEASVPEPAIPMPAPGDSALSEPEPESLPDAEPEPEPILAEAPQQNAEQDQEAAVAEDDAGEESEIEAAAAPGGDADSPSAFEQGIKDMLKPMLNKWLDDNMERIVHDAVKEEVASGKLDEK